MSRAAQSIIGMVNGSMNLLHSILITLGLATATPAPAPSIDEPAALVECLKSCMVSDEGYDLIRTFEGYMPFPYKDIAGIETVGYGYVIRPGDKLTYPLLPPDADALLKKTMRAYERDINKLVIIPLHQNQFDALGSFSYNVGTGALGSSTLLKRVNARRHEEVPACFLMWNKARVKGVLQPVKGLTVRRQAEADHYAGK